MGIFAGLFKKKNNEVKVTVVQENEVKNEETVNTNVVTEEVVVPVLEDVPIITDPSNVLERMQNNFVIESEKEAAEAIAVENDPMSVFNQNINLDNENPMAIFGAESEDNK